MNYAVIIHTLCTASWIGDGICGWEMGMRDGDERWRWGMEMGVGDRDVDGDGRWEMEIGMRDKDVDGRWGC